jgi:hypothetical protein
MQQHKQSDGPLLRCSPIASDLRSNCRTPGCVNMDIAVTAVYHKRSCVATRQRTQNVWPSPTTSHSKNTATVAYPKLQSPCEMLTQYAVAIGTALHAGSSAAVHAVVVLLKVWILTVATHPSNLHSNALLDGCIHVVRVLCFVHVHG